MFNVTVLAAGVMVVLHCKTIFHVFFTVSAAGVMMVLHCKTICHVFFTVSAAGVMVLHFKTNFMFSLQFQQLG